MGSTKAIAAIGRHVSNRLDLATLEGKSFAGVIGDAPSSYSKSPRLWNAAFRHLRMNAVYVAFDAAAAHLGDLLDALKDCEAFLGANVTVPHKVRVMDFLDTVAPDAARIQAVNTVVRTTDGKLVGYNTDGEGFMNSLVQRQPDRAESFLASLQGITVLLLGAGGSARAVGFHVAGALGDGTLLVCNRTAERAHSLAQEIKRAGYEAVAISEAELSLWAPQAGLIVNSTTKGQGGIRTAANGMATMLEPYSALAPADPPLFAEADAAQPDFTRRWFNAARSDIEANHQASLTLARCIPPAACFYDLIYHPEETVFLQHGRSSGHPTMNGKGMIINQAVTAFCKHICNTQLRKQRRDTAETHRQVLEVMYRAW